MEINNELIDKIAQLSALDFQGSDKEEIRQDLEKILGFVDQLNSLDTEGVEPLIHITEEHNRLREDEPVQDITHEEALKNAPDKNSDYFKVPKVLKEE